MALPVHSEYGEDEPFLAESTQDGKTGQHSRLKFSFTRYLYPFLIGVIVSSILWAVPVIIYRASTTPEVSSTPVGSCGTTPDEARARGCHFQLWSYSWVPHDCFDAELHDDFVKLHDKEGWNYYYRNTSGTAEPSLQEVSLEEVLVGDGDGLYSTWGQHYWHCAFYLRRFFRATGGITNRDRDRHHSVHCQEWLASPFDYGWETVNIHLAVGFHECDGNGLRVLDSEHVL